MRRRRGEQRQRKASNRFVVRTVIHLTICQGGTGKNSNAGTSDVQKVKKKHHQRMRNQLGLQLERGLPLLLQLRTLLSGCGIYPSIAQRLKKNTKEVHLLNSWMNEAGVTHLKSVATWQCKISIKRELECLSQILLGLFLFQLWTTPDPYECRSTLSFLSYPPF